MPTKSNDTSELHINVTISTSPTQVLTSMAVRIGSSIGESFEAFFNCWLSRQENFLGQLVQALTSQDGREIEQQRSLVQEVLSHYEQYLEEKSRAAKEEVFLFYSPPWLSSLEKALLWVAGFKPSLLFKLLANSVMELTPEQEEAIERVKHETRREERELTESMAAIQESAAIPPLLNLARSFGSLSDAEVFDHESAVETLKGRMLRAMQRAEKLRGSTVRKLIDILSPVQTVKFLAASAELQLKVRNWGLQKDQQRATEMG